MCPDPEVRGARKQMWKVNTGTFWAGVATLTLAVTHSLLTVAAALIFSKYGLDS